jgi:hypothetical protein
MSAIVLEEDFNNDMKALSDYMSDISEKCWCAGWIMGLEDALWHAVQHGPKKFGQGEITQGNIDELKRLSQKAGGWCVFADDEYGTKIEVEMFEICFVPVEEWKKIYDALEEKP